MPAALDVNRSRSRPVGAAFVTTLLLGTALTAPHAALAQDIIPLEPVVVSGAADGAGTGTDGQIGYTAATTAIGGKGTLSVREIPQAVTIITEERLEDQNITTLDDAAPLAPGLRTFRNDAGRSSIFSRGFELESYYVDGLWSPLSSIAGSNPDLSRYERVEFLKGPAALYAGAGEPGGLVNLVRKRGLDHYTVTGTAGYGSWDHYRAMIDGGGPLNEAGTVRGRGVVAYEDSDGFVDYNSYDVGSAYGNIDVDINENTTVSVAGWHQRRSWLPNNALPTFPDGSFIDVPRSTFLGADWNEYESQETSVIGEIEHRFEDGSGHMRLSARYTDQQADGHYAFSATPADPVTGMITMRSAALDITDRALHVDGHISKSFQAMGLENTLLAGVDYKQLEETFLRGGAAGFATNNIYNPNPHFAEPAYGYSSQVQLNSHEIGAYAQLRVKPVDPLTLIVGARAAGYHSQTKSLVTGSVSELDESSVSPHVAAIYDLTDDVSLYASYTSSFVPQTELSIAGTALDPRTSQQVEAGIKAGFWDDRVNASVAVYYLRDKGRAIADPNNPGTSVASGIIDVNGIEAEVSGSPLPGLEVFAGYTFMNQEYKDGSADLAYRSYMPEHQFNLWSKYTFHQGFLDGVHVAGGVNLTSSFKNIYNGVWIEEDGYVTVDAQLGYTFKDRFKASVTVSNIFDEDYYERVGTTATFNFRGAPRAVWAQVSATF